MYTLMEAVCSNIRVMQVNVLSVIVVTIQVSTLRFDESSCEQTVNVVEHMCAERCHVVL